MVSAFQWIQSAVARPDPSISTTDRIAQAFDAASESTGTSFDYLLKTAQRESSLNPDAQAKTSSAAGLFQFIESTWLETLKASGADYGLGNIADAIEMDDDGRYTVSDPAMREKILALRHDPEVSSTMAGVLTRRNAGYLEGRLGRAPTEGELYIAHFMGARGAAALIGIASQAPGANAAQLFPKHAAANRPIFYESGRARSVSEVYADLVARHTGGGESAVVAATAFQPVESASPREPTGGMFAFAAQPVSEGFFRRRAEGAFDGLFSDPAAAPSAGTATPSSAAFQVYAMAPALFDVAAAEDTRGLIDEAVPTPAPTPSLADRLSRDQRRGPLDLTDRKSVV